jgi:bifunctional pyridoxal-dependent enzyme with beta-cystathionase and maltose regulon repressor activities
VEKFIKEKLPMLKVTKCEGTYLLWIDMRELGLETSELERALMEDAHVFFDDGYYFGDEGKGFERVNIACPTEAVMLAMDRLYNWISSLKPLK